MTAKKTNATASDVPVRFSQSVLDSLQNNPETDSTRAHTEDLKIQQRVREELTRLRDQQSQQLSHLTDSLTISPPKETSSTTPSSTNTATPTQDKTGLAYHLSSPFYQNHQPQSASNPNSAIPIPEPSNRTSDSVRMEIQQLKQKLESRRKVESVPKEVEQAKEKVVQCLRKNDRRPLDCWQEVEEFKRSVGVMEGEFVRRIGR
ncbi:hypothetical protein LTR86_003379 [Recurvomyces mirabilis]|nr:hypothetical protein LTR86_003379 [Recurvomyces mirabilis]